MPEQGGDSWLITDEAVIDPLRERPCDIDLRKVDSLWFMDLIAPFLRLSACDSRRRRGGVNDEGGREMTARTQTKTRQRRGAPWTEEEDARLLAMADLPPRVVADLMRRSWLACRRRLAYLRADGRGPIGTSAGRPP